MRRFGLAVVLGLLASASSLAATIPAPRRGRIAEEYPPGTSFYVVDAFDLAPSSTANAYNCGLPGCTMRYATNNGLYAFQAPVHLPPGASIKSIELDGYDASDTGEAFAALSVCDGFGGGCVQAGSGCGPMNATVCTGVASSIGETSVVTDLSGLGLVAQNQDQRVFVTAGNSTLDGSTGFSRIVIVYHLSVSPPPPQATFADVPTSHPFFQYVEALAESGVTGGCGGGNYCPDAAVTRGQMAVFLSKALGLWFR